MLAIPLSKLEPALKGVFCSSILAKLDLPTVRIDSTDHNIISTFMLLHISCDIDTRAFSNLYALSVALRLSDIHIRQSLHTLRHLLHASLPVGFGN